MTITNLAKLIKAVKVNTPAISSVCGFSTQINKIKRGYAYFCLEKPSQKIILAAEAAGAYAVIYQSDCNDFLKNTEIAHMEVDSINLAILRIIRYFFGLLNLKAICVSPVQLEIAKSLSLPNNIHIVDDYAHMCELIFSAKSGDIFLGMDCQTITQIYHEQNQDFNDKSFIQLKSNSLFFSSFIASGRYYQNIHIPNIFTKDIADLIFMLSKFDIEVKLNDNFNFNHFLPIFVNSDLQIFEFGATQAAIIVENDMKIFDITVQRLLKLYPDIIVLKDTKDLLSLNGINFRYAIIRASIDQVIKTLNTKTNKEPSLF